MADKKDDKKEKPFVDPYSLMKTEDLLGHYEKHHANTPEAADKREGYEHEQENYMEMFKGIQNSYLSGKRGEGKSKGTPKRHALSKKEAHIESSELINKLLLAMVEHDTKDDKGGVNKAVIDLYKKNPHMLREYAAGKGINYEEIKQDLIDNYRNINKSKKFNSFKSMMAYRLIKDLQKYDRVKSELSNNISHHTKIKNYVKSNLQKGGLSLEETVSAPEALGHYASLLESGGKLSEDYIFQHDTSLKRYDPKKK